MEIRKYVKSDEKKLFQLMRDEGPDWECYWGDAGAEKYKRALSGSITYVAYDGDVLCGYVRCRDDDGLCAYIYDLLVAKAYRGRSLGKELMERVRADLPDVDVYVMSGVDGYYEKVGYRREGSIFKVG